MEALVLVDIQNDFMPFGALPVHDAGAVVEVVNALTKRFEIVVATQDWHPADHASFVSNHPGRKVGDVVDLDGIEQVLWPDHCVQGTPGASFHSALDIARVTRVVRKGTDPRIDSYSGFFDNGHRGDTGLSEFLKDRGVSAIVLAGLATDYCVKYTALDGRAQGFEVTVVADGCRAVKLEVGDEDRAIAEMRVAGCRVVTAGEVGL